MTDDDLLTETRSQREELAAVLDGLTPAQWDAPSLCAGWRVREVVAHLAMPYRHSGLKVMTAVLRARGRFHVAADRLAREDTKALSSAELLTCLQENVASPWKPPGGGQLGALSHDVIHGLDITEGLQLDVAPPPERIRMVLQSPKLASAFKVDLDDVRLVATDTDVAVGDGPQDLCMSAKDLLLTCAGRRPVPAPERRTGS